MRIKKNVVATVRVFGPHQLNSRSIKANEKTVSPPKYSMHSSVSWDEIGVRSEKVSQLPIVDAEAEESVFWLLDDLCRPLILIPLDYVL